MDQPWIVHTRESRRDALAAFALTWVVGAVVLLSGPNGPHTAKGLEPAAVILLVFLYPLPASLLNGLVARVVAGRLRRRSDTRGVRLAIVAGTVLLLGLGWCLAGVLDAVLRDATTAFNAAARAHGTPLCGWLWRQFGWFSIFVFPIYLILLIADAIVGAVVALGDPDFILQVGTYVALEGLLLGLSFAAAGLSLVFWQRLGPATAAHGSD